MPAPTFQECQDLFRQYNVPATVQEHCMEVHRVAVFLAEKLIKNAYPLNMGVIKPFSLLHDFMKAVVLERLTDPPYNYSPTPEEAEMHRKLRAQYKGKSETFVAYLILKEEYPEFAQLFLELDGLTHNPRADVHEETKFIHYVDWRVLGNKIVSLNERMDYIYGKYGRWIEQQKIDWELSRQEQFQYEQKIFKLLAFPPEELQQKLTEVDRN